MSATMVDQARDQLEPLFDAVLQATGDNPQAAVFFTERLIELKQAEQPAELLRLFFELSRTAFIGLQFDAVEAQAIDALLESAERIAFALSAEGTAH